MDEIYKQLTRSGEADKTILSAVAGGNGPHPTPPRPLIAAAYLSLTNADEPYLGGIKYDTIPPNKRYMDIEQLSGGEQTVAALALIFAVHAFMPSPFVVLDEMDAALDVVNVQRVARYIRNKQKDLQFIVISLKE